MESKTTHHPMKEILLADPGFIYRRFKADLDEAASKVLAGGWYILGPEVAAFEEEFARYCGVGHAVGVGSGTDALQLALRACRIGPGDLVVTVAHSAVATVSAIELAGATPVLVDIDEQSYTMDPAALERAVSYHGKAIKAIIPVHLYGHPADMPAIMDIARRSGVRVIEDCAQSHGAGIEGRSIGTWGDFAAYSFYPTKNLGAFGDAGGLTTGDVQLAQQARMIRQYGWEQRYISVARGMNTRLDELQASLLRVVLPHLDEHNEMRRKTADLICQGLQHEGTLSMPLTRTGFHHVYHQLTIRSRHRDALQALLKERQIGSGVLYPVPVHKQPAYLDNILIGPGGLALTELVAGEILSLPVHPGVCRNDATRVVESIKEAIKLLPNI